MRAARGRRAPLEAVKEVLEDGDEAEVDEGALGLHLGLRAHQRPEQIEQVRLKRRPWSRLPTRPARRAAKPIVHACDMVPSEMSNEATEIITMAVDKYVTNGATRDAPTARPRLLGCALRAGALSSVS